MIMIKITIMIVRAYSRPIGSSGQG